MQSRHPDFREPSPYTEQRVEELLEQMTLDEKLLLLGGKPGPGGEQANSATYAIERVGLPELRMADGPLGVHWWCDASTAYPALLCAAASFDEELWYSLGEALGRDCRARGVHILLAPGVNIYRSALCGRNFEYAGEDPFLSSRFAVGYIRGVQDQGVCATVKHFALNFQEYARHTVSSDADERTMQEIYFPAFRAAVREAGVGALMMAYNLVNGVQCSESPYLMRQVLMEDWGFAGVIMSDWLSTYSVAPAANAGLGLEMPVAEQFRAEKLKAALDAGEVQLATIDDKVRRLLRLAVCFGWLEREQKDASIPQEDLRSAEVALEVARRGIVLLENESGLLPLDRKRLSRLAVIGPYAHPAVFGAGGSSFTPPHRSQSLLRGIERVAPEVELLVEPGPNPNPKGEVFSQCRFACRHGEGLWAEYFANPSLEGEPQLTRVDRHVDFTWGVQAPAEGLPEMGFSVRWTGELRADAEGLYSFYSRSHDSEYRIWIDDELVIDTWSVPCNGPRRIDLRFTKGQLVPVRVEFRKTRFFTGMHFGYRHWDGGVAEIEQCAQAARAADAAVVAVGWDQIGESEGFDRSFQLPPELEALVQRVASVQPNTIVVITAGGNLDMQGWGDEVAAVLHAFYPGQAGGHALAEILFGLVNPSGRLPFTMEHREEERSSFRFYHDDDGDGRVLLGDGILTGYRHALARQIRPRYPFGYGLSYTRFEYGRLAVEVQQAGEELSVHVRVAVQNVGSRAGNEVVQVYVRDEQSRVVRPPRELKGFAVVELEPGESQVVDVRLGTDAFRYFDPQSRAWVLEPGRFEIQVGASCDDIRLSESLVVK